MLKRELGLTGAVLTGLGSIIGTGVFVSIGIATGVAGPGVLVALVLAAIIATCNGLSSAQLAASHPVSGGTYEYGYRYLNSYLGFTAGWTFLLAKSASAATAALGFVGYSLNLFSVESFLGQNLLGVGAIIGLTLVVLTGIRRSNWLNTFILCLSLLGLGIFILSGMLYGQRNGWSGFSWGWDRLNLPDLLQATALMFVAYSGYARITVLGEEIKQPEKTIPKAILITLAITLLLYMAVAGVGIGAVGATALGQAALDQAAPLQVIAASFPIPGTGLWVALGAIAAMIGILLNLILGLSRVILAMARRGDLPKYLARLNARQTTPVPAVLTVAVIIALLTLIGNVKTTWSFSAFSVLIYYAITNLAALKLPSDQCFCPRWLAYLGLYGCLGLAFWVEPLVWLTGLGFIGLGCLWHRWRLGQQS